MSQKKKRAKKSDKNFGKNEHGLWLAPRFKMKAAPKKVGWELQPRDPAPSRLVELADKALDIWAHGIHRPRTRKSA